MFFSDYRDHQDAKLRMSLLWEYDTSNIDYEVMRKVIVQRVIELGREDDWYFILNRYGIEKVKETIKELPCLNKKDMRFVSDQFSIPLNEMLHTETLSEQTLELLKVLMRDELTKDFFLVGGTALSLQIGHRISEDIDLFTIEHFDENNKLVALEKKYGFELDQRDKGTLIGYVNGVKVDLICHPYPLLKPLLVIDGIRMTSLRDIAAMKLNAISGSGKRLKDFIDIGYLSSSLTVSEMLDAFKEKYALQNPLIALKAIN